MALTPARTRRQSPEPSQREAEPPPPDDDPTGLMRLLNAVASGLTEGDDIVVEEIDGKLYEVMHDGRRLPIPD